jgi:Holliday junction resolvase RusA-like endonuclease
LKVRKVALVRFQAKPPENGELDVAIEMAPASLQAPRKKKDAVVAAIREAIGDTGYILSGEVKVVVEWLVHPRLKCETTQAPDIDNVIKVTLDALCGPAGLLINDCQVQSVECSWTDWNTSNQHVGIHIRFMADEWLPKDGLRFVRIKGPLCFPLMKDVPIPITLDTLERIQHVLELRSQSGDWYAGRDLMPIQRLFHVGHLKGFAVVDIAEIRQELDRGA